MMKERSLNSRSQWLLIISGMASLIYLSWHYLHVNKNAILFDGRERQFVFIKTQIPEFYKIEPGTFTFFFHAEVNGIVTNTKSPSSDYRIVEINPQCWQLICRRAILFSRIELTLAKTMGASRRTMKAGVSYQPVFKWKQAVFNFVFLALLGALILSCIMLSWNLILHRSSRVFDFLKLGIYFSLGVFLLLFIYLVFNLDELSRYLKDFFVQADIAEFSCLLKALQINIGIAVGVGLSYLLVTHLPKKRLLGLLLLFVLALIVVTPDFNSALGNFLHYQRIIDKDILQVPQLLSMIQVKILYQVNQIIFHSKDAAPTFVFSSKIMGLVLVLAVFLLLQRCPELTSGQKFRTLLLCAVLPPFFLYFGYHELEFYSAPFLILGAAFSRDYFSGRRDLLALFLATFFIILAGLYHAVGLFSLPVVFLAPFIKRLDLPRIKNPASFYGRHLGAVFLTLGLVAAAGFLLYKTVLSKHHIVLSAAEMLVDSKDRRFIEFFPSYDYSFRVAFLSPGYFTTRSWIALFGLPILLAVALLRRLRSLKLASIDVFLFFLAVTQLCIFFFVSFDLGVIDFSLYLAPMVMVGLFFAKLLGGALPDDGGQSFQWRGLLWFVCLALFTSAGLFLALTTF